MEIAEQLSIIKAKIGDRAKLVAVSKTKPNSAIQAAYECGQRVFGENKVQELTKKFDELPKDIEWHYIGHLQTNKVKYIAPFVSLIHGVDSIKLVKVIDKEGKKCGRKIKCLLQFHIAKETTKFGFSLEELRENLTKDLISGLANVEIVGVMGMATFSDDEALVRSEFQELKRLYDTLKLELFADVNTFTEISMGMSDDYLIAIEEGSTMVRIGSSIFGERNYS